MSVQSTWQRIKLSQIAEIERNSIQPSDIREGTRFVGLEHIASSGALLPSPRVSNGDLSSTKFSFSRRHVLYGKLRPYLSKIARPEFEGVCSTDILPILPGDHVDRDYLYYFLRQPELVKLATERSIGANLPRLSPTTLAEFEILLPPLPTQKQIAAILEKTDAARVKRRQANQLTEQFLQSAFLGMFGDPVTNPKGWSRTTLDDACTKVVDGTHFSPPMQDQGVPYITAKHLKPRGLDFYSDPTFILEEHHREIYRRCDPVRGDVLYIKDGATTGIAAVNQYEFEFSMLSSLALIRPKNGLLAPQYLSAYLNSPSVKESILRQMAGGAIKRLTVAKIKKLSVHLPPFLIQQEFVTIVERTNSLRAKQGESEKELDNLFNSLMQKAFRGELVE